MENKRNSTTKKTNFYCLWIMTGYEEKYVQEMKIKLSSPDSSFKGNLYLFGMQMRLKSGKEYIKPIFPNYVFLETEETQDFSILKSSKGFMRVLPSNDDIHPLSEADLQIVKSILQYGSVIPIVHVNFDVNDKIQLLDGPFEGQNALVKAVNKRNKRVNLDLEFMNGIRLIGLTYEEVQKM